MSTRKVAAAEGMPEINRRTALVAGASLAFSAVPAPAAPQPEHPWVKARRLAKELSAALAAVAVEEGGAAYMAEIYPPDAPWPVAFIDATYMQDTAEERLRYHAKHYARAARLIDPTATLLWMGRAVDDSNPQRFSLNVVREG